MAGLFLYAEPLAAAMKITNKKRAVPSGLYLKTDNVAAFSKDCSLVF